MSNLLEIALQEELKETNSPKFLPPIPGWKNAEGETIGVSYKKTSGNVTTESIFIGTSTDNMTTAAFTNGKTAGKDEHWRKVYDKIIKIFS